MPAEGGVLIAANHVSWLDGLLIPLALYQWPRRVRMIAWAKYVNAWWLYWFSSRMGIIPIGPGRKDMVQAIRAARQSLGTGHIIGIFPEGGISRNGQLRGFREGLLTILKGSDAPVVPVYIDGLWGSVFSFEGGRFFWKWPRRFRRTIRILIGRPMHNVTDGFMVRQAVQQLGVEAMEKRRDEWMLPTRNFLRMCRRALRRPKAADSTGAELTGSGLLMRSLILRRILRREVLAADENHVGLLLPPSVAGLVTNAALLLHRRVPINLNYTVSSEVLNACIDRGRIRTILTSRRVMERFENLKPNAKLVYLEDFKERATTADKLVAAAQTWLMPSAVLERHLGLTQVKPDDVMTIIFTSGSTGDPKGVVLTYRNVGTNVEAFNDAVHLRKEDVLLGVLPFFHSFGYTVTIWAALMLEPKVVYHFNPLEYRPVGALSRKHGVTIIVAAPTFLRTYVRRCEPEDFAKLDLVITGAEKLPVDLADAFEQKFRVRPAEGYGTTELSPVVSTNVPPSRAHDHGPTALKEGSVGRPLPGIAAKVVDLETGEELGPDRPGMLLVTGPNVMLGYLDQPDKTAEVMRDGWYVTGDVARIDEDGFIFITGRESRFSKIAGEMIPHIRVEELLTRIVGQDEDKLTVAVTAVADPRKGERLVVLHTGLPKPPDQINRDLAAAGLPPLWIPSPDSYQQVDEIPVLGSGKLDLRRLKELAVREFAAV